MNRAYLLALGLLVTACPKNVPTPDPTTQDAVVLDKSAPPGAEVLKKELGIEGIPYIANDTYIGNPMALLGEVVEVRKKTDQNECPSSVAEGVAEFSVRPVSGFKIDAKSVLNTPVKRGSKLISREVAANIAVLNYLSAQMSDKEVVSAILFDQAGALADTKDATWASALAAWVKANESTVKDANVCYLAVVRGFVQKNLVRRTFRESSANGAGGAYGVNVDGKYLTAAEDFEVDVRFGLNLGILKRPNTDLAAMAADPTKVESAPTAAERAAFAAVQTIQRRHQ